MRTSLAASAAATLLALSTTALSAPTSMLHTLPKGEQSSRGEEGGSGNWLTKWFRGDSDESNPQAALAQAPGPRGFGSGPVAYMPPAEATPSGGAPAARLASTGPWGASDSVAATPLPAGQPTPLGSVLPSASAAPASRDTDRLASEENSTDCKSLRERGHAKDREGDLAAAERLYRRAIAADPTSAAAVNDLGLCLARQGRLDPSAAVLRQAILMRPDKRLYRNNLATVLVELGRVDDAVAELTPSTGAATAHYNVGQLLLRSRKTDLAAAQFREAAAADPDFAPAREALAQFGPAATFAATAATNLVTNTAQGIAANAAATVANIPSLSTRPDPAFAATFSDSVTPIEAEESPSPAGAPSFPRLLPPVLGPASGR